MCFCRRAQHFVFFVFLFPPVGAPHFFLFYYHRPWTKLLWVIFFAIAQGRKQLIVKRCIFAHGRRTFHYTFLTSPVGEKIFC